MPRLALREYQTARAVPLTLHQRDELAKVISVTPSAGTEGSYDLTPTSTIGALRIEDLDVAIEPKIPMHRVFFMLSYALGRVVDIGRGPELERAEDLVEAIVQAFAYHARRALGRGVQQGYRTVDESALTLRGRLRVGDQIRRRFGPLPPAEITYDDYTVDIEINRLVRAATQRLLRLRLRSSRSLNALRGVDARLQGVSLVTYDARRVPSPSFSRLTERYRDVVTLARFILRSTSFDLGLGLVPASAFLVDMNRVFEDFLYQALREALGHLDGDFVQGSHRHALYLDEDRSIKLEPDLSLWRDGRCLWIGDAKYKRLISGAYPNADIYQVTAYAIATGLDRATLVYARSEAPPATHRIVNVGKIIDGIALDLSAPPAALLLQVAAIADQIHRAVTCSGFSAAA